MSGHGDMRTIRILDPATVNKIAAGEVVERPASVVKELVENAIDAAARTIRIEVSSSEGKIVAIGVTDDGTGMSYDDAVYAFAPHATSKITSIADLDSLATLGFRGEALASIAAVSRVTLLTKPRGGTNVAGTRVVIEGGNVREHREAGTPEGTNIVVSDLFFNTPARKKFQKRLGTELAHLTGTIEGLALAHPGISFRLTHNAKELLATEQSASLKDTIACLFGDAVAGDLIPVEHTMPYLTLSGYISRPSLFRKNQSRMFISINGRYVSSAPLAFAIIDGYGTLLSKDRFPVVFLCLAIGTALVDVNVHPAKKLVRLSHEPEICSAVRDAVKNALLATDLIPFGTVAGPRLAGGRRPPAPDQGSYDHAPIPSAYVGEPTHSGIIMTDRQLRQTELPTGALPETSVVPEMEVIGQAGGIYLIAATASGDLILIDQHAAHERIMYELVSMTSDRLHRSQELIAPVTLHRSARDAAVIRDLLPLLEEEGFRIEDFGRDSFLVRAVPVVLDKVGQADLINEIVDDLAADEPSRAVSSRERLVRIIACRSAIKAGTVCTPEQCRRLVWQLRKVNNPFSCPHGRPTMVRFSREQLDGMFKRT
jgi:DNA mismatch repair protein MutL